MALTEMEKLQPTGLLCADHHNANFLLYDVRRSTFRHFLDIRKLLTYVAKTFSDINDVRSVLWKLKWASKEYPCHPKLWAFLESGFKLSKSKNSGPVLAGQLTSS
jgi:hypothetical protein